MTDRITWEGGQFGHQKGYILGAARGYEAKILIFELTYTVKRDDIANGTPYILKHRLPFRGIERKFGDIREAQKHAERYLLLALELMGFVPKPEAVKSVEVEVPVEETAPEAPKPTRPTLREKKAP